MIILLCLEILIILASLAYFISKRKNEIFISLFLLVYILVFPLSGLYLICFGELSVVGLALEENESSYYGSVLLSFFYLIVLLLFYSVGRNFVNIFTVRITCSFNVSFITFPIVSFISFFAIFLFVKEFGSLTKLLTDLDYIRSGGAVGLGYLQYPATMFLPLSILFYITFHRINYNNPNQRLNLNKIIIMFFISVIPLVVFGFRGPVVFLIIQFLLLLHLKSYISLSYKKILFLVLVLFIVLVFWGMMRSKVVDFDLEQLIKSALDTVVFRTRGIESVTVIVKKGAEYNYFIPNLIESVTSFIPRSIYHNKPISTTEVITTLYYSEMLLNAGIVKEVYGGVNSTMVGHSFWSLGSFGVGLNAMMTGLLISFVQNVYQINRNNNVALFIYITTCSYVIFYIESFQLAINAYIMNLITLVIFMLISIITGGKILITKRQVSG